MMEEAEFQLLKRLRSLQSAGFIDVIVKAPGHQALEMQPRHMTIREIADEVDTLTSDLPESDRVSTVQIKLKPSRGKSQTGPGATPELPPIKTDTPACWDLVLADMAERDRFGKDKYGVRLQPHNGRSFLRDLYQELLDAVVYLRGEIYEREGK